MKLSLIGNAWATFEEKVLPATAPDVQKRETKRAFYAGASSLLNALARAMSTGGEVTDADIAAMDSVAAELNEFDEDVRNGKA